MSSLDKCKAYNAMVKAVERYSGDPISVAVDQSTGEVRVLPILGSDRALFGDLLAEAIKRRGRELIDECLAEAKRQAIDQAENVQRTATAALEGLKG